MAHLTTPAGRPMNVPFGEGRRRLPIYLLLDCSYSMEGAPLAAMLDALERFVAETKKNTLARETVHVGVIPFQADEAHLISDELVPIDDFAVPELKAAGNTPLGAAFRELTRSLDRDVTLTVKGKPPGDWKPLVYVLTDGRPTDDWAGPRQEVEDRTQKKLVNVITVGFGPEVDDKTLAAISTGPTYHIEDRSSDAFKHLFMWVTQTAVTVNEELGKNPAADELTTTAPPAPAELRPVLNF
ncbi:vWA domain-containing protein [Nonomuraea polychroma]|uniref:vWA domain-containing protein n=1 Tax=Nonomuraea polychroma TaxID=46176 RepID=UPI003D90A202